MFVLRCTKKLLTRIGTSPHGEIERSASRMGDWSAHIFIIRRQQLVLAVNQTTFLPVLLPVAPAKTISARLPGAIEQMLRALGIDERTIAEEVKMMGTCVLAATNSRQVLGVINDFGWLLEAFLDGRPLLDVALHLARTPCGPLGMKHPSEVTRELLGRPRLYVVK